LGRYVLLHRFIHWYTTDTLISNKKKKMPHSELRVHPLFPSEMICFPD
jgi:hypothetical protein